MMCRAVSFGLGLAALLTPIVVAAQDDTRERARAAFQRGVEAYARGEYQQALDAFEEAYRVAPHPNVRVNIANCYEQLDRPVEALFHFERFLREAARPAASQRREVEAAVRRLRRRVGELELQVAPDGALITIDGTEQGRAPLNEPVRVVAGTHTVEIRMDGYRAERQSVEVAGGSRARMAIRLQRLDGRDATGFGEVPTVGAATGPARGPARPVAAGGGNSELAVPGAGPLSPEARPPVTAAGSGEPVVRGEPGVAANAGVPMLGTAAVTAPSATTESAETASATTASATTESATTDWSRTPLSDDAPERSSESDFRITPPTWIAGGLTLAAGIGVAITGGLALAANSEFERNARLYEESGYTDEQARTEGRNAANAARTFAAVADGLLVTTIVGAGATVFLLLTTQEAEHHDVEGRREPRSAVVFMPRVGPTLVGVEAVAPF